jgi:hypothetical protein
VFPSCTAEKFLTQKSIKKTISKEIANSPQGVEKVLKDRLGEM